LASLGPTAGQRENQRLLSGTLADDSPSRQ
jgi:hypothetical protein